MGVRLNPPFGSGFHSKAIVAGADYSFGIWHENLEEAINLFKHKGIPLKKLHCHIGAGSDPEAWLKAAQYLLDTIIEKLPDVEIVDLGGGFKVARGKGDIETDISDVSTKLHQIISDFKKQNLSR